jgi:hypothetical protein
VELVDLGCGLMRHALGQRTRSRSRGSAPGWFRSPDWSNLIRDRMRRLADRLRRVRICCGDWTRVCGGRSGNALTALTFGRARPCGVFLDPPYADTAQRDSRVYRKDDPQVAHRVREWALAHGDDPRLRIALCGYEGEHDMPDSWSCVPWKTGGGYGLVGDGNGKANAGRERIWFSKHCLNPGNR